MPRATSAMLSQFGDPHQYFEAGSGAGAQYSTGWTGLYSISAENEPWAVNPVSTTRSLQLFHGGRVTSPSMCLAAGEETFRFFYKGNGTPHGTLTVKATITSSTGTYIYNYSFDASGARWQLSPTLSIPNYSAGGAQTVKLEFINSSTVASTRPILIDDVLVDPWRNRGW